MSSSAGSPSTIFPSPTSFTASPSISAIGVGSPSPSLLIFPSYTAAAFPSDDPNNLTLVSLSSYTTTLSSSHRTYRTVIVTSYRTIVPHASTTRVSTIRTFSDSGAWRARTIAVSFAAAVEFVVILGILALFVYRRRKGRSRAKRPIVFPPPSVSAVGREEKRVRTDEALWSRHQHQQNPAPLTPTTPPMAALRPSVVILDPAHPQRRPPPPLDLRASGCGASSPIYSSSPIERSSDSRTAVTATFSPHRSPHPHNTLNETHKLIITNKDASSSSSSHSTPSKSSTPSQHETAITSSSRLTPGIAGIGKGLAALDTSLARPLPRSVLQRRYNHRAQRGGEVSSVGNPFLTVGGGMTMGVGVVHPYVRHGHAHRLHQHQHQHQRHPTPPDNADAHLAQEQHPSYPIRPSYNPNNPFHRLSPSLSHPHPHPTPPSPSALPAAPPPPHILQHASGSQRQFSRILEYSPIPLPRHQLCAEPEPEPEPDTREMGEGEVRGGGSVPPSRSSLETYTSTDEYTRDPFGEDYNPLDAERPFRYLYPVSLDSRDADEGGYPSAPQSLKSLRSGSFRTGTGEGESYMADGEGEF